MFSSKYVEIIKFHVYWPRKKITRILPQCTVSKYYELISSYIYGLVFVDFFRESFAEESPADKIRSIAKQFESLSDIVSNISVLLPMPYCFVFR